MSNSNPGPPSLQLVTIPTAVARLPICLENIQSLLIQWVTMDSSPGGYGSQDTSNEHLRVRQGQTAFEMRWHMSKNQISSFGETDESI